MKKNKKTEQSSNRQSEFLRRNGYEYDCENDTWFKTIGTFESNVGDVEIINSIEDGESYVYGFTANDEEAAFILFNAPADASIIHDVFFYNGAEIIDNIMSDLKGKPVNTLPWLVGMKNVNYIETDTLPQNQEFEVVFTASAKVTASSPKELQQKIVSGNFNFCNSIIPSHVYVIGQKDTEVLPNDVFNSMERVDWKKPKI